MTALLLFREAAVLLWETLSQPTNDSVFYFGLFTVWYWSQTGNNQCEHMLSYLDISFFFFFLPIRLFFF